MSLVIEQDREQTRKAVSLHSRAEIARIWLVDSSSKCSRCLDEARGALNFSVGYKVEKFDLKKGVLRTHTSFSLKVTEGARKKRAIVSVDCVLGAEYALLEGFRPSPEEIEAFQKANAVFNCWPYFREYAANTVVRMGFPPPPIPFLRLVPKLSSASEKERPIGRAKKAAAASAKVRSAKPRKRAEKKGA